MPPRAKPRSDEQEAHQALYRDTKTILQVLHHTSIYGEYTSKKNSTKSVLIFLRKYYIVANGLTNYLLGFYNRDSGHAIENVVYFELLYRGYDVAVGKVGTAEVDFIATKADEKLYIQVTESMVSEDVRTRELTPLMKIRDNYEKIVLSMNPGIDSSYDGIKSLNLIEWLIG